MEVSRSEFPARQGAALATGTAASVRRKIRPLRGLRGNVREPCPSDPKAGCASGTILELRNHSQQRSRHQPESEPDQSVLYCELRLTTDLESRDLPGARIPLLLHQPHDPQE